MTKCPKCKFYSICGGRLNETVENCVRFKSAEQTNEEWFCQLNTSEKSDFMAKVVSEAIKEHTEHGATRCESSIWWDEWLKEIYDGNMGRNP